MEQQLLAAFLEEVRPIAQKAGTAILQVAAEDIDVTEKSDGSPLSRADIASHRAIQAGLDKLEPRFPILSEEGDLDNLDEQDWGIYWCVDPLDGTKEFIKGLTDYTVNIALVKNDKPILGVIDIPAIGVTYWAAEGLGAWKCETNTPPERIAASKCSEPASAVVSRSHLDAKTEQFLARLGITNIVPHGSSLKICAVADGTADIYPRFGPTCLWDTAAGAAIAIEAGCAIVDLAGDDLMYDPGRNIKHAGFVVSPVGLELPIGRE
ncbi:MAG: 3'(2'),5'-bisphosphate nucleotidase CysQ [Phycisphaerae bacterium]|jgi:3'(2'), 5'-bisphosphate nucleotidase|nr:3'(2'),5'-bisphosphate nucleotidase CysQ [Phycisphaerae bacterium]